MSSPVEKLGHTGSFDPTIAIELGRIARQQASQIRGQHYVGLHSVIDPTATIGQGTTIGRNVSVAANVHIGECCVIQDGARIGQDGYGFDRGEDGSWTHKAHCGGVIIGNGVHIGANTCIDQGTYEPTRIGDGSIIDNLCHIAHNVQIGKHVAIIALSMVAGSVVIEDGAYIAPHSAIRDHRTVGADALVGQGSNVVSNVPSGSTVKGNPAR